MAVAESRAGGQWGWGWSAGLQVEEALDESGRAVAMAAGRGDELDLHPPLGSISCDEGKGRGRGRESVGERAEAMAGGEVRVTGRWVAVAM